MKFEWDDDKNTFNYIKHGVWFEEAQTIWANELAMEFYDPDHSGDEDRYIRIGFSARPRLLLVVFCEREENVVRLISARPATKREQGQYEKGI